MGNHSGGFSSFFFLPFFGREVLRILVHTLVKMYVMMGSLCEMGLLLTLDGVYLEQDGRGQLISASSSE
jgi:hypothetical protein